MTSLLDHRMLLIAGKGGVGRTTSAAVIACAAARLGKRVLLAQTHAPERLGRLLGYPHEIGPHVVYVRENIWAVNIDPQLALREYGLQILRYETLYKALFENKAMRNFLGAFPGIDYWTMLGKTWWHTTETLDGKAKYDLVILDGPASGHALAMLRIPAAVQSAMSKGPLARDADQVLSVLENPEIFTVVLVTLPEDLPARETLQLRQALTEELHLPVGPVLVNGMPPAEAMDPTLLRLFETVPCPSPLDPICTILSGSRILSERRRDAERIISQLMEALNLPFLEFPRLPTNDLGPAEIEHLAGLLIAAEV